MAGTESEDAAIEGEYIQEIAYLVPDLETTCTICHAEFLDSEDLDVHVKQVHEGTTTCPKNCQFCDVTYTDLEDYARHIRDDHLLQLKSCRGCTKCFTDQRKAKKHEKKHHSKSRMYACSQCTGLYTTQIELEMHEIVNHDNNIDGVIVRCMPHLSSLLKLKVLALLHTDDRVLVCNSCEFSSIDYTAYFDHLKDDKCSVCVCDKCGDVFKTKKNLMKHYRRKNKCMYPDEFVNELTTCPTCNNEVYSKQMQAHLKFCNVYKCTTCDIRFGKIDELSTHQSEVHPLELDVTRCKYCTKEYVGEHALEKHVERTHKPTFHLYKYACKECNAIFKHPQFLFAHYFTRHKNLEPYTCKICDKKFKIRKRFTIHIKMEHKGAGVVEFDEQYHVFFADKKSEKPFIPTCVIPELVAAENVYYNKKISIKEEKSEDASLELSTITIEDEQDVETHDEQTEEKRVTVQKTKKRQRKVKKNVASSTSSDEDEVEPLIMIKKRAERKRFHKHFSAGSKKMKQHWTKRKQFTCKVCNKYCYTFQNYHNHIKIHSKNELIACVKCSRSFRTKKELNEHVSTDHATSKLIETLKSVLERKQGETQNDTYNIPTNNEDLAPSERFSKTIKKVKVDKTISPAVITPAPDNLSVKNFIENFTPEVSETSLKEINSEPVVSIKHYDSPFYRTNTIKLTRFTPETPNHEMFKLKMPERFKEQHHEKVRLNVKLVHQPIKQSVFESCENVSSYEDVQDSFQEYDDFEQYRTDGIPEVAQEVMLEGTEEPPKQNIDASDFKIVIPKLPEGYKNIHIATLQPEAPFYKIIKVKGNKDEPIVIDSTTTLKDLEKKKQAPSGGKNDIISLPDGSKFVTVNPLSHLLGDKDVEKVLEPVKNNYYKPSITNFKGLLAEALQNLDNPAHRVWKAKKKIASQACTE